MSVDGFSQDFFKGPAYALVIGISKYKHGKEHGQELSPKEFPNLKVARRDADDFAGFLEHYGFIDYNVRKLVDDDATLTSVKDELDALRKRCKQSASPNPLVIVFFSGHGWADDEERHYLIPFDAERDRLRATALLNSDFSKSLDELPTNRLVVFIDACHAGAMGAKDVKGAVQEYDVRVDLGEGQGRYLIASCQPGQKSYELEENSIFTSHLLELLKCDTDDIEDEEVDVFTLFKVLKEKVKRTAKDKYGKEQEPTTKMTDATGIVLAINERVRTKRVQMDGALRDKKIQFFEAICDLIKSSKSREKTIIAGKLQMYAQDGRRLSAPDDFYAIFDEYVDGWEPGGKVPDGCCELLIIKYSAPPAKAVRPKESNTQERPKPVETTAPAGNTKLVGIESPQVPPSPVLTSAGPQQHKRRLSPADVEYVLAEIMTFEYYGEFKILSDRLKWPVSEAEILAIVLGMASKADDALRSILERIITRLRECWPNAEIVESKSLASVMLQKGNDV